MLVMSRKKNERVRIRVGDLDLWVTLVEVRGDKARLGFEGPKDAQFMREEVIPRLPGGTAAADRAEQRNTGADGKGVC